MRSRRPSKPSPQKNRRAPGGQAAPAKERCFFGANASRAILRMRPGTVRKLIVDGERRDEYADLEDIARAKRIAFGTGTSEELDRIAETGHHQGVCVFAREYPVFEPREVWPDLRRQNLVLFLDGVGNPHNLGAILRTAAHFGVVYVAGGEDLPRLSPSAARTAEGAGEHVRLVRAPDTGAFFREAKREGFTVVVASLETGSAKLQETPLPRRAVLVLGSEVNGVSPGVRSSATSPCTWGTGLVESLNVSVTAAVFLHEWSRQRASAGV